MPALIYLDTPSFWPSLDPRLKNHTNYFMPADGLALPVTSPVPDCPSLKILDTPWNPINRSFARWPSRYHFSRLDWEANGLHCCIRRGHDHNDCSLEPAGCVHSICTRS